MAAVTSLSLLRNCAATTVRAFVAVKASNPNFKAFLLPLQSQRSLCRVSATSNEEAAAKVAAANADSGAPTIFDKIIAKEIPSSIVYEDDKVLAFRDINPQAPVHVVIIPKNRDGLTELAKAESRHVEILGQLLYAAKKVAEKEGILDGFRVVINNGPEGCQSVYHLHLHLLGGRQMKWPPG
ncbi:PREDICTED: 14 kDa zinc-binding protein [Fragaria vesca subsp. vesca]|uniref:14 kDa zinc-binding protein n=1 Tax=Fragaria vesca subsp. vesca TaxID=101020 RepID=UPI0002C3083E|nr:PREDICTED: 14 kDa zinc-binding protein [Fragaria vesca subsp. vesca]